MNAASFNWKRLLRDVVTCLDSAFMSEMVQRRTDSGVAGSMGAFDAAVVYAIARMCGPKIAVETGTHTGMSSTFILHAMRDAKMPNATLHSIDRRADPMVGCLIPENLRPGFVLHLGEVDELLKSDALPGEIDLFLHDSTHRYQYQRWEFESFWPRLRSGGFLVSHDVDNNASFLDFVSRTYVHDHQGQTDVARTAQTVWGRLGGIAFVQKKAARGDEGCE
jgi:predicted O-methyltransferase YrrM